MSTFAVRAARPDDNVAMLRLLRVAQPSHGVLLTFERTPDYFHSVAVTHEVPDIMVAERSSDGEIVGVASMGSREVYINGEVQQVRYGSDLRIAVEHQGSRLMMYIVRAVRERLQEKGWYQAVILEENQRTREVLEGGRAGLPNYRPHVGIETWTLTGRRHATAPAPGLRVHKAALTDIPAMNAFVRDMAAHYQLLPVYDFSALIAGSPYFKGLTLDDFLLVSDDSGLRGLVGLWNQKAFKQTRVVGYSRLIALLRPFYNFWGRIFGGFILPARGEVFDYRVLHSPLTAPDDSAAFDVLLDAAWQEGVERGCRALTITLADTDPRRPAFARFRALSLRGRHYTVAFNEAAHPEFDSTRIPFFECGRL